MQNVTALPLEHNYRSLRVFSDPNADVHWCFMHARRDATTASQRPCFHPTLLKEIREVQERLGLTLRAQGQGADAGATPTVVLASDADVFNLGGDLDLFSRLIRGQDRRALLAYARACVEGVHAFHAGLGVRAHSIALVQGAALGGGFEAALSCNTIVAESGAGMGLPEVLFDLFPGMGAFSFLSRRVGPAVAERMMLSGTIYESDELHRMGVVDVLAPKGQGVAAVEEVIRRHKRIPHARRAMLQVRDICNPVTLDELMRVTEVWVDTAMELDERSLKTMERLVRAQERRHVGEPAQAAG
jgi:DSF synthase